MKLILDDGQEVEIEKVDTSSIEPGDVIVMTGDYGKFEPGDLRAFREIFGASVVFLPTGTTIEVFRKAEPDRQPTAKELAAELLDGIKEAQEIGA